MLRYDLNSIAYGISEHTDIKPTTIFEIGSRDGDDARMLIDYFKLNDFNAYVFEAIPEQAKAIKYKYPAMNVFPNMVSDVTGSFSFNVEPENIGASSMFERKTPTQGMRQITVDAVRMDKVIEEEGINTIDVLKLDVEGASLKVLNSFGKHIDKLQSIQVECEHAPIWNGGDRFEDVGQWLMDHGFVMVSYQLLRCVQSDSFWVRKERLLV